MQLNPVVWFEIYVQDIERAKSFYEKVFEITMQKMDDPNMQMFFFPMDEKSMGAGGAILKWDGVPSGGNSTLVYFNCEDCAVEAGRVVASGGRIFKEKLSIGQHGFIALVFDTEGNMIGLHSMK